MGVTNTIAKLKEYFDVWHKDTNAHTELLKTIYPIGSIYITTNNSNPKDLFGGNWIKIEGRFLLASGTTSGTNNTYVTDEGKNTGGSANAIVVEHGHTQKPHNHQQNKHYHTNYRNDDGYKFLLSDGDIAVNWTPRGSVKETETGDWHYVYSKVKNASFGDIIEHPKTSEEKVANIASTAENLPTGQSGINANMPPYLVVNVWRRTA